ncbi:MAG: hypothetical protein AAFV49_24105, partial [Pseudomonadota bacterium]
ARWFAELDDDGASDEAIARCLAAQFAQALDAESAAAASARTYSQALRTGLAEPPADRPGLAEPPADRPGLAEPRPDAGWARPAKERPRTAAELRAAALELHREASAFRGAAIRSRAVRGPSALLARDRAAAQREGWLQRRDAAAALFFAANNADLVAAWRGAAAFRDVL